MKFEFQVTWTNDRSSGLAPSIQHDWLPIFVY